jgi:protein-tyrosine-phosphatase
MSARTYNVLFLCTGNSARSILAEAILNRIGAGRFKAYSAGSFPKGAVNPHALALLKRLDYPTEDLRSKSWDEFSPSTNPQAPALDVIITVCDNAAGEICPIWPGRPVTARWSLPDPAAVKGSDAEIMRAFEETHRALTARIEAFLTLPLESLDRAAWGKRLDDIGRTTAPEQ